MPLPRLPKVPSIQGDTDEKDRKIVNVKDPEENQDVATKKWVADNYTSSKK